MIKIKNLINLLVGYAFIAGASVARAAQGDTSNDLPGMQDLTIQRLFGIVTGLVCWLSRIAIVLIVVAIIFYGLQFMTAQGNPDRYKKAKDGFFKALLGTLIILGTYTIIATIANAINPGGNYQTFYLDCAAYF